MTAHRVGPCLSSLHFPSYTEINSVPYSRLSGTVYFLKPRSHQQQCRSYKSNDSFNKVEYCFHIVAFLATFLATMTPMFNICFDFVERTRFRSTLLPKPATLLSKTATMSKQHSTLSKERNFTINSFDIFAVFGNKVECCFDKVERCFDIVAGVDGALRVLCVQEATQFGWRSVKYLVVSTSLTGSPVPSTSST